MITLLLTIITQILTQALPISSSAHVVLLHVLFIRAGLPVPYFNEATLSMLHIPSLCIVMVVLRQWYGAVFSRITGCVRQATWRGQVVRTGMLLTFIYVWVSTGVTVAAYYMMKNKLIVCPWSYAGGFAIMALLFIAAGYTPVRSSRVTPWSALIVGIAQSFALCPGISRLGITYIAGRLLGWRPRRALSYSFLLELVLMSGAVGRALWHGTADYALLLQPLVLIVALISAIGAYFLLRLVMTAAQEYRLWWVSGYLAILSLLLVVLQTPLG